MKRFVILVVGLAAHTVFGQEGVRPLFTLHDNSSLFERPSTNTYEELDLSMNGGGKKSAPLAFLYSLVLPGMGELYVGEYQSGKYFTIGEGVLWLSYGSFETYGTWLRDDARSFAVTHAGITTNAKDDQFFVDIGNFRSTDEYNQQRLRDREADKLYDASVYFWRWDNDANRASYRDLRISHDRVFNNTRFVVAAIIVNHLVSAVNAARLAVSHNKGLEASLLPFHASVIGGMDSPQGIMVTISKTF